MDVIMSNNKIDINAWVEFKVGELFEMHHGSRLNKRDRVQGDVPFITAGFENQGIAEHIGNDVETYKRVIAVDMFGNCFYHAEPVAGDDNVYFFDGGDRSDASLLFVVAVMGERLHEIYSYGNQFRQGEADRLTVRLPVTPTGEPDWDYMDSYMSRILERETPYADHFAAIATGGDSHREVDTSSWGEFHLYDERLFTISMGNKFDRGKMFEVENGIAFVGRSALNNGVACDVQQVGVKPYPAGCLTLALGGSIGTCCLQERAFYTSQNVAVLEPVRHLTLSQSLFFTSVIHRVCTSGKYQAFSEEINKHLRRDLTVKLPVTPAGDPDWEYMDSYMSRVMERQRAVADHMAGMVLSD